MARLFSFLSAEDTLEPNYSVEIAENGKKYFAWEEDFDYITIDENELRLIASALGFELTIKDKK